MSKFKDFFATVGQWFKKAGIATGKWFKNWVVEVDGKPNHFVKIGRWTKSLFVSVDNREPGFVTLYKKPQTKSVLSSLISIAGGLLLGIVILFIVAIASPTIPFSDTFKGIIVLITGAFFDGSASNISVGYNVSMISSMFLRATPLLLTGLSVAIAFKTGLFNIGAPGQYLMGTMGSLIVALGIPTTPQSAFWVWLLALLVGIVCGMLWGAIPGLFKALLNINEVIVCIMTNWIAASLVSWVFSGSDFRNIAEGKAGYIMPTRVNGVQNPRLGMDWLLPGTWADGGIIIAILIAIVMFILLTKTTLGYELRSCGFNKNASKYAGMNEKRNIVLSMAIAGGLSACGAALYFLNGNTEFYWETSTSLPAEGFNGIAVALLASNNPVGVIFSALFMSYLNIGGSKMPGVTAFNEHIASIIVAVIIYFSGFAKLIRDWLELKGKKDSKHNANANDQSDKDGSVAKEVQQ